MSSCLITPFCHNCLCSSPLRRPFPFLLFAPRAGYCQTGDVQTRVTASRNAPVCSRRFLSARAGRTRCRRWRSSPCTCGCWPCLGWRCSSRVGLCFPRPYLLAGFVRARALSLMVSVCSRSTSIIPSIAHLTHCCIARSHCRPQRSWSFDVFEQNAPKQNQTLQLRLGHASCALDRRSRLGSFAVVLWCPPRTSKARPRKQGVMTRHTHQFRQGC